MKVELLKDKDAGEIAELWHAHHQTKDCVAAVIPAEMYKQMKKRFEQFNTVHEQYFEKLWVGSLFWVSFQFLFPLPRKQGYEFIVVAFSGNEAHFTTLINYQAFTENAPECLTMVHYTDLMESKGIVLMVGEFDKNVLVRTCTKTFPRCEANFLPLFFRLMTSRLAWAFRQFFIMVIKTAAKNWLTCIGSRMRRTPSITLTCWRN